MLLSPTRSSSRLALVKNSADYGEGRGTYWTSPNTPAELRAHLRKCADSPDENQESGFEQSLASLSYAYLADRVPRLLPFLIGFQLIDRNDDNTKAVGVFGFKLGRQWMFAPVFFLNGDLEGKELLYLKQQDVVIPLAEKWVNYLMARRPHVLGEGSSKDVFQLGGLSPNIERLSYPPSYGKYGSDAGTQPWAKDVMPLIAACANKSAGFIFPGAGPRRLDFNKLASAPIRAACLGVPSFADFLTNAGPQAVKTARDWYQHWPGFRAGIDRFHGGADLLSRLDTRNKAAADSLLAPGPATKPEPWSLLPGIKAAAGDDKVRILTRDAVAIKRNLPPLTDDEKTKALLHGYLVKDERTGKEVTKVYNTQIKQTLMTPDTTGLYEVLESPGSFEKMLVITAPADNSGHNDFVTVVRLGDGNKSWLNAGRHRIFVRNPLTDAEYRDWHKGLPKNDTLETGATYMAVAARGQGTAPFTVRDKTKRGELDAYRVDFHSQEDYKRGRPGWAPKTQHSPGAPKDYATTGSGCYLSSFDALIVLNAYPDTGLRAVGGALYIPTETFKFLKLKDPPKPKKEDGGMLLDCCGDCGSEEPRPIAPGDLQDLQLLMTEKTAEIKLIGDNHEVSVMSKVGSVRLPYTQALFHLIRTHGCDEASAHEMLKSAQVLGRQAIKYRLKYADSYPYPGPGPGAPAMPPPLYGTEPRGYRNVTSIYPQQEEIPIPALDSSRTDPRIYDPFLGITPEQPPGPDQGAMQVAQQAAQSGQKEVFDTAAIAAMLKATGDDQLVDKHLGDLMKALNALGRILISLYWHGEEMRDRYGKSEIGELTDSVRNTFSNLGDVVLYLREKSVKPESEDLNDLSLRDSANS